MSGRWYKRNGSDFIHGTMGLSLEEKGAYSLCLDLMYDRGGPIPDDVRWLSGVCNVSTRKWNSLRKSLIEAGKLVEKNGLLSNARADLEIASAELQRKNQAESGAKGGRKRAENDATSNKNNDKAQATLKPIEEIRREEIPEGKPSGRSADDVMWEQGKLFLTNRGVPVRDASSMLGKWRKDHGSPAVIDALGRAQRESAIEPISFIEGVFRQRKKLQLVDEEAWATAP